MVCVQAVFFLKGSEGLEDDRLGEDFHLANVFILELEDGLLRGRSEQINRLNLHCQPHVVGYLHAALLQLLIAVVVGLHVEEIRAEDGVGLDLVKHDLAAEVLVAEVQALLADCLCLYPVVLQLVSVVLDYFLDLLVDALEVVPASLEPLLLTVIFEFEHSVRDDLVDQVHVVLSDALRLAFRIDVKMHGQEEDILVEA